MGKLQITNYKLQTNSKFQYSKSQKRFWSFEFWSLDIVWNLIFGAWNSRRRAGFTLLEMVISLGIFSVLVVLAIGVVISVSRAQTNAAADQAILDNVRFGLELITKELRTGVNYNVSSSPVCGGAPGTEIHFSATSGSRVYYLQGTTIMRATADAANPNQCYGQPLNIFVPFTAPEITTEKLGFRVRGANPGPDDGQPTITVSIQVSMINSKTNQKTGLNLQTTVVQRQRDL